MTLADYTDEQLREELMEKVRAAEEKKAGRPKVSKTIAVPPSLIEACEGYLEDLDGGHPEPDENPVFEAAMEAVYGKDVWTWIKKAVVRNENGF